MSALPAAVAAPAGAAMPAAAPRPRPVWVIASGKGGVGKSSLSVLLAAEWASRGVDTLLFDGVQNEGNLHLLLGRPPARAIPELLRGGVSAAEIVVELAPRLGLLPAPADEALSAWLAPLDRARLHHRLTAAFDAFGAVIVDAGPGRSAALRAATLSATGIAVVATPEPAALHEAYAMLKLARLQAPHLVDGLIVNRAESAEEAIEVHARLELATRRFLGRPLDLLGVVPESSGIRRAGRAPGGLLRLAEPDARRAVRRLADRLGAPIAAAPQETP